MRTALGIDIIYGGTKGIGTPLFGLGYRTPTFQDDILTIIRCELRKLNCTIPFRLGSQGHHLLSRELVTPLLDRSYDPAVRPLLVILQRITELKEHVLQCSTDIAKHQGVKGARSPLLHGW